MNGKLLTLGGAGLIALGALFGSRPSVAAGQGTALVRLQAATPGVAQVGHLHVSGTAMATSFVGNGAGLSNVNADLLDGINSTAFLQSVPVPLSLSGSVNLPVLTAENSSPAANTTGVYGRSTYTGQTANYGGHFESNGQYGRGVWGEALSTTGTSIGVAGDTYSSSGKGISGFANSSLGTAKGVYGSSNSVSGYGVFGESLSNTGVNYGVYGRAAVGSTGFAVFASGDLGASGVKPFRIDHPLDPLHKYLLHYASESPFPQNFYVGTTVTDEKGYAWIELPSYFEEVNCNFKYQLTVIDDEDHDGFVLTKVSKKIRGNHFQIRTSAPNVEVSWEVKADRNDLYVRSKKPLDEVEKVGPERDHLQRPELYGVQDKER